MGRYELTPEALIALVRTTSDLMGIVNRLPKLKEARPAPFDRYVFFVTKRAMWPVTVSNGNRHSLNILSPLA